MSGPTVTVTHYTTTACDVPHKQSIFQNIPNTCVPIYEDDDTVSVHVKMQNACHTSRGFLEVTFYAASDASCEGVGNFSVLALSSVGCNRDREEGKGYSIECTGGEEGSALPYLYVSHGDTRCREMTSTSVVPNVGDHSCSPVYEADRTVSGYVSSGLVCGYSDHVLQVEFFGDSGCTGEGSIFTMWVNDPDSCNGDGEDGADKVQCYGYENTENPPDWILVKHGSDFDCNDTHSVSIIQNVPSTCVPVYESRRQPSSYAVLGQSCNPYQLTFSFMSYTTSDCSDQGVPRVFGVGHDLCNFHSFEDEGGLHSKSIELTCWFGGPYTPTEESYFFITHYDQQCSLNRPLKTELVEVSGCHPVYSVESAPVYAKVLHPPQMLSPVNPGDFSILNLIYTEEETCASGLLSEWVLSYSVYHNGEGEVPKLRCNAGESGFTSVRLLHAQDALPTDTGVGIIVEHYWDDCKSLRSTLTTNSNGETPTETCLTLANTENNYEAFMILGDICHPDVHTAQIRFFSDSACEGSYVETILATGDDFCNMGENGRGLKIHCRAGNAPAPTQAPFVFVEHGSAECERHRETVILINDDQCHPIFSPDAVEGQASSSGWVKLDRPCSVNDEWITASFFDNASCNSPSIGTHILKTGDESCNVAGLNKTIQVRCFGVDEPAAEQAFIVVNHGNAHCANFSSRSTFKNQDEGCNPMYNEEGQLEGYMYTDRACSIEDHFLRVSMHQSDDCQDEGATFVIATQGECNIGGSKGFGVSCYGNSRTASLEPFIMLHINNASQYQMIQKRDEFGFASTRAAAAAPPEAFRCGNFTNTAIVQNIDGECVPRYDANRLTPVSWVRLDQRCSEADAFITLNAYETPDCSDTPKKIVMRANGGFSAEACNVGRESGAIAANCYAPELPANGLNYVFVSTGGDQCQLTEQTLIFENSAGSCHRMHYMDTPEQQDYISLENICAPTSKFLTASVYKNDACTGESMAIVARTGADYCNFQPERSSRVQCFAPSNTQAQGDDYIFATSGPTCGNYVNTIITPNVANQCNPSKLMNGSTIAYNKFAMPCEGGPAEWTLDVFADPQCTQSITSNIIIVPDGTTCNVNTGSAVIAECYGGSTAPPSNPPPSPSAPPQGSGPVGTASHLSTALPLLFAFIFVCLSLLLN
jgi:hypothetical protein